VNKNKKPKSLQRSEERLNKIVEHFKKEASKNIGETFNLSVDDYRALNGQKPLMNEAGIPLREPRRPPPKTSEKVVKVGLSDHGHFLNFNKGSGGFVPDKWDKWPAVKEYPIEAGIVPKDLETSSDQEVVEKVQTAIYNNDYRGFSIHDDFNKLQKENEQLKAQLAMVPPKKKTFFEKLKEWMRFTK
jgi:hypothetical protein